MTRPGSSASRPAPPSRSPSTASATAWPPRSRIIDNGPGIPDAIRDTLFYPMITGKEGGTGLGLSIAQNLIDQHKGRIDCISWPGHTEFTIYLPLRK